MQSKFVILMSIFGVVSALSFSTNQNVLLSVITALVASAFGIAAYFSKDKKDKQIEELHRIATSEIKPEKEAIAPEKQEELIALIKESCDSKFNLRNTYRNDKIDSLLTACASRGFTMPEGSVYGGALNLYINELQLFSDTVSDAIMEALNSEKFIVPTQPFVSLLKDIIWSKSKELGVLYYKFVDKYPHPMKKQQQLSAFAAFDKEASLLIAKVTAQIKLKGEV